MDLGIEGKWALVCGASKGLGLGCASALVNAGVNVIINARGEQALETAGGELEKLAAQYASGSRRQPRVVRVAADITTTAGRMAVFEKARELKIDFDIVVTNAGGPPPGDFREWDRDAWVKAVDANMLTPIELIRATVDGMAERGFGRIINITSSAVKAPIATLGLSNGARSGLTGFVAGVARTDIAARGVTINNLLPGKFDTDRLASSRAIAASKAGVSEDEIASRQKKEIPAQRFGTPAEFGAACAFLSSVHASYITGQNLLIDGGMYPGTY